MGLRTLRWLVWMVFFRPVSLGEGLQQEFNPESRWLVATLVTTATTAVVLATPVLLLSMALRLSADIAVTLRGVAVGVAFAVGGAVAGVIAFEVVVAYAVAVGAVGGAVAVAVGAAFGVAFAFGGAVAVAVVVGVAFGVAFAVDDTDAFEVAVAVAVGGALAVGLEVTVGTLVGASFGFGVTGWVAFGITVGYFRLFLVPVETAITLWALVQARRRPQQAMRFLSMSLAYWDELMLLPQPFLTPLLVRVGEQDRDAFLSAVAHLTTHTFQRRAAIDALLEFIRLDLLRCRALEDIAQVSARLGWLLPQDDITKSLSSATAAIERCQQIGSEVAVALSATSDFQRLTALNRARKQLDGLRQLAVLKPGRREAQVFIQVAQQWLAAVVAETDRLTEEARVTERIPNPYVAPGPLSPGSPGSEVFTGRDEVFRYLEEHFLRAGHNLPTVLHGQPRIGKSSILRHLATRLPRDLIPVYVDMQRAAQVESTGGLLFNLGEAVEQALTRRGVNLPAPALGDFATEPFIIFARFLDAVEAAIQAREQRLILALDEFEEIERKLSEGRISRDLMPFLRNMMQHRHGIALLFAGTHTLDQMIAEHWTPYFRSAVPCKVSYLGEPAARRLVTNPIDDFPLDYTPGAVDYLLEVTHRHPCLIQLVCSALVDRKNEQASRLASVEDVVQASAQALETGDYVFLGIWDWIPADEQAVLSVVAPQGQTSVEQLLGWLGGPDDALQRIVARLVEAEVIEASSEGSGPPAYRFQVDLFRRWVERHTARTTWGGASFGTATHWG